MTEKAQNRKHILQQLLQKSELFNQYLKNEENMNSILNLTQIKKNQFIQFGKCEINLPQKVRTITNRITTNKIMVLTKNKKEALQIKQKYGHLQRLEEIQFVQLQQSQSYRKNISQSAKRQVNTEMRNFTKGKLSLQIQSPLLSSPPTISTNSESYEFAAKDSINESPERMTNNVIGLKCRTKQSLLKNRSNSAKVRPQFDFFLKYHPSNNLSNRKQDSMARYKCVAKEDDLLHCEGNKKVFQNQMQLQIFTDRKQQQCNALSLRSPAIQKQISINKQQQPSVNVQPLNIVDYFSQTPSHSSTERRSNSFLIKKHSTNGSPTLLINKNYQQNLQEIKKNKMNLRRQLHKTYKRAFVPPPKISAKSYAIYEVKQEEFEQSGKILATINGKMAQEIASLTKIMTCLIVLQTAQQFKFNIDQEFVEIGKFETNVTGTSAQIRAGEVYSVNQLLYGLMLPSGNDASLALGVWAGKALLFNSFKFQNSNNSQSAYPAFDSSKKYYKKDYIQRFVQQMNSKASVLGMTRTHYANTHGLVNCDNKSAAIDIALLCQYAMSNQKFAKIVSTKVFKSTIKCQQNTELLDSVNNLELASPQNSIRVINYQNTHYLLHKKPNEYIGIKTGITTAAGPCLASYIQNKQTNRKFIIVVLDCKSTMMRFKQTQILKKWLYKQQNIEIKSKKFKGRSESFKQERSQIHSYIEQTPINSDIDEQFNQQKCED